MKVALFTAADKDFFHLLEGMLESLTNQLKSGINRLDSIKVIVFDVGLDDAQRSALSDVKIIDAQNYDLTVCYPGFNGKNTSLEFAMAIRPFLREFTDNVDAIIWADADVWFQGKEVIKDLLWGSNHGPIAAVPETGRLASYVFAPRIEGFMLDLAQYYGDAAIRFSKYPIVNAGLFCANVTSPIWKLWKDDINLALSAVDGKFLFGLDQTALNYSIYSNGLSFVPLPFTHNYTILPTLVENTLCFYNVPFEKIQAMHLTGDAKWKSRDIAIKDREGNLVRTVNTHLDYKSISAITK